MAFFPSPFSTGLPPFPTSTAVPFPTLGAPVISSAFPVVSSSTSFPLVSSAPSFPIISSAPSSYPVVCNNCPTPVSIVSAGPPIVTTSVAPTPQVVSCPCPTCPCPQPQEVRVIESAPEVRYVQPPPEIRYVEGPPQPPQYEAKDMALAARMHALEQELMTLRTQFQAKQEVKTSTKMTETYKVKTFEQAAKLAAMDGTDDGLYNGIPIEIEGEGLYRDLVRMGRRPKLDTSLTGRQSSVSRTSETYKVATFELAEKLAKSDGRNDGKYNGLPIEVVGEGLYSDLLRAGRRSGVRR